MNQKAQPKIGWALVFTNACNASRRQFPIVLIQFEYEENDTG
jgi:hypothetical protein